MYIIFQADHARDNGMTVCPCSCSRWYQFNLFQRLLRWVWSTRRWKFIIVRVIWVAFTVCGLDQSTSLFILFNHDGRSKVALELEFWITDLDTTLSERGVSEILIQLLGPQNTWKCETCENWNDFVLLDELPTQASGEDWSWGDDGRLWPS